MDNPRYIMEAIDLLMYSHTKRTIPRYVRVLDWTLAGVYLSVVAYVISLHIPWP